MPGAAARAALAVPIALATVLAAACVGPSRTDRDFRLKATSTADQVLSAVNTAVLAADAGTDGRATAPYLSVLIGEAEEDAVSASGQFASIQPPSEQADELRSELDELLSEATDGLAALRITVRRGEIDRLADLAAPLRDLAGRLDDFSRTHG